MALEIPIEKSKEKDIFDFGFDKNLNKITAQGQEIKSPTVYGTLDGAVAAQSVSFGALAAGALNSVFIADPAKGIWLGAEKFENAPFRVNMNGDLNATSVSISGVLLATIGTFGGDGSDGAISITSGTTTVSAGSGVLLIKNYTSISVTGSATLAFSTPATNGTITTLKSQGNVTLTSSAVCIDASGMGGAGGAGGTEANGSAGSAGRSILDELTHTGGGGQRGQTGGASTAGTAGAQVTVNNSLY